MFSEEETRAMELMIDEAIGMLAERWQHLLHENPQFTQDLLEILTAATLATCKIALMFADDGTDGRKGSHNERDWNKLNHDTDGHARRNVAKIIESLNSLFGFNTESLVFAQVRRDEAGVAYWFARSALEAWPGASGGSRLEMVEDFVQETIVKLRDLRHEKDEEQKGLYQFAHVFALVSASKILLMLAPAEYADAIERVANRAARELMEGAIRLGGRA